MTLIQTDPRAAVRPRVGATVGLASGSTPPAVRFDGVSRRFGDVVALDSIDLTIEAGETVALLGPNGAGKSTAIGLMLGLLEPTSGTVADPRHDPGPGRRQWSHRIDAPGDRPRRATSASVSSSSLRAGCTRTRFAGSDPRTGRD